MPFVCKAGTLTRKTVLRKQHPPPVVAGYYGTRSKKIKYFPYLAVRANVLYNVFYQCDPRL